MDSRRGASTASVRFSGARVQSLLLAALAAVPELGGAQSHVCLTSSNLATPYSQVFDAPASGFPTDATAPATVSWAPSTGSSRTGLAGVTGWYWSRAAGTSTVITAGAGASNSARLYSFGVDDAADRALGSLGSGTPGTQSFGAIFQNNTGGTVRSFEVSFDCEQWRDGGSQGGPPVAQTYAFSYGTFVVAPAGFDTTPYPSAVPALDLTTQVLANTGIGAAVDGNAAGRAAKAATITLPADLPEGHFFAIKWIDLNDAGNDHALAVDNFTLLPIAPALDTTPPTVLSIARRAPDAALTNAASVFFRVTFSEAVTGVEPGDFEVDAAGVVGAVPVAVTPVGADIYDVAVATGAGDGTVSIDLSATATITDLASNALASGFAAGESYTIDRTPPTSSVSTADETQVGTIVGVLNATDANGITSATLFARHAPAGSWTPVGDFTGPFAFAPGVAGRYYLRSASTDAAGNAEQVPTGTTGTGDAVVLFNPTANAAFAQFVDSDGDFRFPMEADVDIVIRFNGVTVPGTVTVSRRVGDLAPGGLRADQLIDQSIEISAAGGFTFAGASVEAGYNEALLGGLPAAAITSTYRDSAGTVTGPFAVNVNTSLQTITFPTTGFSAWYFGTATASVGEWMLVR